MQGRKDEEGAPTVVRESKVSLGGGGKLSSLLHCDLDELQTPPKTNTMSARKIICGGHDAKGKCQGYSAL